MAANLVALPDEPPISLSLNSPARPADQIRISQSNTRVRRVVFCVFGKRQTILRLMQVNEQTVALS